MFPFIVKTSRDTPGSQTINLLNLIMGFLHAHSKEWKHLNLIENESQQLQSEYGPKPYTCAVQGHIASSSMSENERIFYL